MFSITSIPPVSKVCNFIQHKHRESTEFHDALCDPTSRGHQRAPFISGFLSICVIPPTKPKSNNHVYIATSRLLHDY